METMKARRRPQFCAAAAMTNVINHDWNSLTFVIWTSLRNYARKRDRHARHRQTDRLGGSVLDGVAAGFVGHGCGCGSPAGRSGSKPGPTADSDPAESTRRRQCPVG